MPRKGKRSQAAKQRWQTLDLADQPISPSTQQTAQPETPPPAPSPWTKTDAITPSQSPAQKTAQPETPPPAPSLWTKKDAITPSQSPAQKMARLPIAALAAPVVGRTKKTRRPAEPEQQDTRGRFVQGQTATLTAQPETPPPAPSSPPARRVSPKVVVMDEVAVPRPSSPFEWRVVGRTKKTHRPAEPEQQVDHSFPLNPVWFSPAILDAMEEAVPSHLPSAVECRALGKGGKKSTVEHRQRRVAFKRRQKKQQVEATASAVESSKPSPRSLGTAVVTEGLGASCSDKPLQFTSQDSAIGPSQRVQSVRATHSQMDQRSARGLPHSSGTAIVLTFCELSDMVDHLHALFADRSPYASYELMPVSFESDHGFSETLDSRRMWQ
ncbi:hypothetical protein AAFF_G00313950 [Aldrovandia affinis]|uniref:Uncharacterized protein n=1 Tax=Aldrovandia affinis TaxID=143900 RepID=A0AAD7W116_9TELE|nr:hypothetical protein AAFF_G00313950 [Aldrovandia affinis]